MKKIVLVGGGTGGHFYPLIAIAEALKEESVKRGSVTPELYYFGPDEYDKEALAAMSIRFVYCPSGKKRRYFSPKNFFDIFKVLYGMYVAFTKLFLIYPDVIMSKGGYTSVPVVLAGWFLRIPIVVHESDAVPGKANKLAAHFARYIAVTYPDTLEKFPKKKTAISGIPVRKALLEPVSGNVYSTLGVEENVPIILVFGGSQGAERINTLVLDSLDELLPNYSIVHQTGDAHFEDVKNTASSLISNQDLLSRYHPIAFLQGPTLNQAMHAASMIISRAGSGSIYEIALHGKPSIIIPIPEAISHDQRTNAYAYARTGAAAVIEEENMRDNLLAAEINRIIGDQEMYRAMGQAALSFAEPYAAEKVALTLIEIADEHL